MGKKISARLAVKDTDYQRLGIKKGEIAFWEDGVRTTGKKGEYEWWYFDAKLQDGSSLVIVFYTAPMTAMKKGFFPSISLNLTRSNGTAVKDSQEYEASQSFYDRERCRIRIGKSSFEGDLHTYAIHYETDAVKADVCLKGNMDAWRPETGHIFFGEEKYFAWLPSVPEGYVEAAITINGRTETITGTGYHDHNWGNTGMFRLMHHWYWGRAKIGEYQAITSYITGQKKYGYEHFPIFMLAKNGELLADNGKYVTFEQKGAVLDTVTGKHYHKYLIYDYNDGRQHYRITYKMENLIEQFGMSANPSGAKTTNLMRMGLRLAGLDPSYLRMTGRVKLEKFEDEKVTERIISPALWEMMYFGKDANV